MKTFKEYLAEAVKTYQARIKIAGELPENFESKLKILGIKITREFNKKTLTNKEFKTSSDPADIPRYKAA